MTDKDRKVITIQTQDLGLAAYLKMHRSVCKFIKYENKKFVFESTDSEMSLKDWEISYLNSCCKQHDTELVMLRNFMSKNGKNIQIP